MLSDLTNGAKILIACVLVALLAGAGLAIYSWDKSRLDAAYARGVAAERAVWTAAQAKADKEQRAREDAAQATSDKVGADARAKADELVNSNGKKESKAREAIQNEYQNNPASAASCDDDGRPAPVPDGVQNQLREAQRAAEAAGRELRADAGRPDPAVGASGQRPSAMDADPFAPVLDHWDRTWIAPA